MNREVLTVISRKLSYHIQQVVLFNGGEKISGGIGTFCIKEAHK